LTRDVSAGSNPTAYANASINSPARHGPRRGPGARPGPADNDTSRWLHDTSDDDVSVQNTSDQNVLKNKAYPEIEDVAGFLLEWAENITGDRPFCVVLGWPWQEVEEECLCSYTTSSLASTHT